MWIDEIRKERDYKSFVGPADKYEMIGQIQFSILKDQGLKEDSKVLDIGCGSLRLGKRLIPYLDENCYYGIEPEIWLVEEALKNEVLEFEGKRPFFMRDAGFNLANLGLRFDFIFCNSVFIHASLSQVKKCIRAVPKALKGKFIFNFIPGKKDNNNLAWTYPSHVYYKRETIKQILKNNKLSCNFVDYEYPGKQQFVISEKV